MTIEGGPPNPARRDLIRNAILTIGAVTVSNELGLFRRVIAQRSGDPTPEFPMTHTEFFSDTAPITGQINTSLRDRINADPILKSRFESSQKAIGHLEPAQVADATAVEPASRVFFPYAVVSGHNGPPVTQVPSPTEKPLPTNTPPLPTATSTASPTQTEVPATPNPERGPLIENLPLPPTATLLQKSHTETRWATAGYARAATCNVMDVLDNGLIAVQIIDAYSGEPTLKYANPADIGIDPAEIDKALERQNKKRIPAPEIVNTMVTPKRPVKLDATDRDLLGNFPWNEMQNNRGPVDYQFDMTLEPQPDRSDPVAGFGFSGSTFFPNGDPHIVSGCQISNQNGHLFLIEVNYDGKTGKVVENSYDLKVEGMRTSGILRVIEGKTISLFLPKWNELEQKYTYEPHITIPLTVPIEDGSWLESGPFAAHATAVVDNFVMTAQSNITSAEDLVLDPTRNEEKITDYLPNRSIGVSDPQPTEMGRVNYDAVIGNVSVIDTTAYGGTNQWRLGALLLGDPNGKIIGFPETTTQRADSNGQVWHPSIDATGIKDLPAKYMAKEGRDEYIKAVFKFALAQGNYEDGIIDAHVDSNGNVSNDWVGNHAETGVQTSLIADEITTTHEVDPERGIRFKLPRNFSLTGDNVGRLFTRIDAVKADIEKAGGDAKIEGIHIYPQGSTAREFQLFLLEAQNRGITVHVFGLADRSQNHITPQKSTPVEIVKSMLDNYVARCAVAHTQGGPEAVTSVQLGEMIFDSDHQGGYDNDPKSVETGTQYLIRRKNNREYEYTGLYHDVLDFARDRAQQLAQAA